MSQVGEARHAGKRDLPKHGCARCLSVRFEREPSCAECGARRPPAGWPGIETLGPSYLGRTLDDRFLISRALGEMGDDQLYRATALRSDREYGLWILPRDAVEGGREHLSTSLRRQEPRSRELGCEGLLLTRELLELADGSAAVLMDNPRGETLDRLLETTGPLEAARACAIGVKLARILQAGHRAGLVQHHLRPRRVFVSLQEDPYVQLAHLDLPPFSDVHARRPQIRPFCSPEERRGDPADAASNIYGLGALLFLMLTAEPPSASWSASDSWGVRDEREMRRASDIRAKDAIPSLLDNLIVAMLARKPLGRPANLDEVIEILERFTTAPRFGVVRSSRASRRSAADSQSLLVETGELPFAHGGAGFDLLQKTRDLNVQPDMRERISTPTTGTPTTGTPTTGTPTTGTPITGKIRCATQGSTGEFLAVDEEDRLWRVETGAGAQFEQIAQLDSAASSIAADGESILVGMMDGTLRGFGSHGDEQVLLQTVDRAPIEALAIARHDRLVLAAAKNGRIYAGRLAEEMSDGDWQRVRERQPVIDVAAASRQHFAVLREAGVVELRNARSPFMLLESFEIRPEGHALALSGDGQLVAVAFDDAVELRHGYRGQLVATFPTPTYPPLGIRFTDESELVAICQHDSQLSLWDVSTDSPVRAKRHRRI